MVTQYIVRRKIPVRNTLERKNLMKTPVKRILRMRSVKVAQFTYETGAMC